MAKTKPQIKYTAEFLEMIAEALTKKQQAEFKSMLAATISAGTASGKLPVQNWRAGIKRKTTRC
jgi:hypothetical protein